MIKVIQHLKEQSISILLSEQNLRTASALYEKTIILEKGQIVFHGALKDVLNDPDLQQ